MRAEIKINGPTRQPLQRFFTILAIFGFTVVLLSHAEAKAAEACRRLFMTASGTLDLNGLQFLHGRDPKLHTSAYVEKNAVQYNRSHDIRLVKPAEKIDQWLLSLEKLSVRAEKSPHHERIIKDTLYNQFVMTRDAIPDSYYDTQVRVARERGHGDVALTKEQKQQLATSVIVDQKKSLDTWIEYMISKDTQVYPMWLKYWMFSGMTKLSKFDPQSGSFGHRSKETVAPFPELDREALAYVADSVLKKVNKDSLSDIQDKGFLKLLDGPNFGKLYGAALKKSGVGNEGQFPTNEGFWVIYKQGSDPRPLVRSLEGRNTGWCTAGEATAGSQLKMGDFHVYYSMDKNMQSVLPRVAIRMQGDQIAEVRGVAKDQNLDPQIQQSSIIKEKMTEFGDRGKSYERKESDMQLLTQIEFKGKSGNLLSKEDLRFLYELDRPIKGFGYSKDPRIEEIKKTRDTKNDFVIIYDNRFTRDEISLTAAEALSGKARLHHGDLDLHNLTQLQGVKLPELVTGNLYLNSLQSAVGLKLPKVVKGGIHLDALQSAVNLKFSEVVGGGIYLNSLRSAEGLMLPDTVHDVLILSSLQSAKGLKLPGEVRDTLDLRSLQSAEGLKLPKTVLALILSALESARELKMPEGVRYYKGPVDIKRR